MNPSNITIIPPTIPNQPNHYLGTYGKIHVVGYALVIKGTGSGVQIRKNIRKLILDQPEWELLYVTTDYSQTENQDSTCKNFFGICRAIRSGYIDVLIIDSTNDLEQAYSISEWLIPLCKEFDVTGYIAHNDSLLSEFDFML